MKTTTAPTAQAEPAGYVNGDELDNILDDQTALLVGKLDGYRRTPVYRDVQRAAQVEPTDGQILAAATKEFPRWHEDIQEQFVLRVVRAALAHQPAQAEPVQTWIADWIENMGAETGHFVNAAAAKDVAEQLRNKISESAVSRPANPWAPVAPRSVDEVLDLVNEYSLAFKGERYEAAVVLLGHIRRGIESQAEPSLPRVHQALLDSLSEILDQEDAKKVRNRMTLEFRDSIGAAISILAKLPRVASHRTGSTET